MSTPKKRNPAEVWDAIMKMADDDRKEEDEREMNRIAALSEAELDAELTADGFDPAKVRADGLAFVAGLMKKRDAETKSVEKLEREHARLVGIRARRGKLDRAALQARIALAKTDPRLPAPIAAQFRNRGTEAASDEELESVLDALEAILEHHDEDDGGDAKP